MGSQLDTMKQKITWDTLISQVPKHIIQSYPKFFMFLEGYYEWIFQENNPYYQIKHHLSALDFQTSMDEYVEFLKMEYLHGIPESILLNKELFIKWSRKFHLAKGSHYSYKFLFSLLFDEQDTEIYLPKENIFKLSDNNWIDGQSKIIVTNNGSLNDLLLSKIYQKQELIPGIVNYVYADVDAVKNIYNGNYNLLELTLSNLTGEFLPQYPIENSKGVYEWIFGIANSDITITNSGTGYKTGSRIELVDAENYTLTEISTQSKVVDFRITSSIIKEHTSLIVDGIVITDYSFDGRYVNSDSIFVGSVVELTLPTYSGYISVEEVDENGSVTKISIDDLPIGLTENKSGIIVSSFGSDFACTVNQSMIFDVPGHYKNSNSFLSSTTVLTDSKFYQEYSYLIKTKQDISRYGSIVKEVLHPAGFAMFGQISIIEIISVLLSVSESEIDIGDIQIFIDPEYDLGANYSFRVKCGSGLSQRLYKNYHFTDKPYDAVILRTKKYLVDDYIESDELYVSKMINTPARYRYDINKSNTDWTFKHNLEDYHLFLPQDYSSESESGIQYFETGYVTNREEPEYLLNVPDVIGLQNWQY